MNSITLILGGARSGKSRYGEEMALGSGLKPAYIATAEAWDDEMRERIAVHQDRLFGRGWLENRAKKLIGKDGSFSQYSLNYHRMLLDTLSIAEVWRQRSETPSFSLIFYSQEIIDIF